MISGRNVKKPTVVKGSVESMQERVEKSARATRDATASFVKDGGMAEITQKGKERMMNLSVAEAIMLAVCLLAILVSLIRIYGMLSGGPKFEATYEGYKTQYTQVAGEVETLKSQEQMVQDKAEDIVTYSPRSAGEIVATQQTLLSAASYNLTEEKKQQALSELSMYMTDSDVVYAWLPRGEESTVTSQAVWSFTANYLTTESGLRVMWVCNHGDKLIAIATGIYQETTNKFSDMDIMYFAGCDDYMKGSDITTVQAIHLGNDPIAGMLETADPGGEGQNLEDITLGEETDPSNPMDEESPEAVKPDESVSNSNQSNDSDRGGSSQGSHSVTTTRPSTSTTKPSTSTTKPSTSTTKPSTSTTKPSTSTTTPSTSTPSTPSTTTPSTPSTSTPSSPSAPESDTEPNTDDTTMPPGTIGSGSPENVPGGDGFLGGR